jgi:hypothetical protein
MNRRTGILALILALSFCSRKNLGDENIKILFEKEIAPEALGRYWRYDEASVAKNFQPSYKSIKLYDYEGVKVLVARADFADENVAFGFKAHLTAEPRNVFDNDIWYKVPYVAGRAGKTVVFAFSTNQISFFSPYVRDAVREHLKSVPAGGELSWHREVLPQQNRFFDAEFYLPQEYFHGVAFENLYGAKYQIKNSIARIYIARYGDEGNPKTRRETVVRAAHKKKLKVRDFPGKVGPQDRGSWWKNEKGGVDGVLAYRWLVFYFSNFADEWTLEQMIQECFAQMYRVREKALARP